MKIRLILKIRTSSLLMLNWELFWTHHQMVDIKDTNLILRRSRYLAQKVLPQCGGTCCVYTFLYFHSWIATIKFDRAPFIVACHHLAHLTSKAYELFMPKNLIYLAPMVLCFPLVAALCKSFFYLRLVLGLSLFVFFCLFLVLTMSFYCPNLS